MARLCCLFLVIASGPALGAQCLALSSQQMQQASPWMAKPQVGHVYKVEGWYVQDGDSLRLAHGQRLRLGQINTTEMASKAHAEQPYARQAKHELAQRLGQQDYIYLRLLPAVKDHYGRWLVQVYDAGGVSAEAMLVARGLAYVVSMGAAGAEDCLWHQEAVARRHKLGVWQLALSAVRKAQNLSPQQGGFMRLAGVVTSISESQHHWYIGLGGQAGIKIAKQLLANAPLKAKSRARLEQWMGQPVTARGWLSWRKLSKKQRQKGYLSGLMTIYHLDMLEQTPILKGI